MDAVKNVFQNKVVVIIGVILLLLVCACIGIFLVLPLIANVGNNASKTITTGSNTANGSSTTHKKPSAEECSSNAAKFDGKIYDVKGTDISGTVGLKANVAECRIEAYYHLVFQANLPENRVYELPYKYNYIAIIHSASETDRSTSYGIGVIFAANKNKTSVPEDVFTKEFQIFYGDDSGITTTNSHYAIPTRYYELSDAGLNEMTQDTVFEIIDSASYVVREPANFGGYSFTTDTLKAEKEGNIVKTYNFTWTAR